VHAAEFQARFFPEMIKLGFLHPFFQTAGRSSPHRIAVPPRPGCAAAHKILLRNRRTGLSDPLAMSRSYEEKRRPALRQIS
jgi:hypothetical protein